MTKLNALENQIRLLMLEWGHLKPEEEKDLNRLLKELEVLGKKNHQDCEVGETHLSNIAPDVFKYSKQNYIWDKKLR